MPITLEDLRTKYRDDILKIAEKYGVTNIRVFGSVARGDARDDSDVDFIAHFEKPIGLTGYNAIHRDFKNLLHHEVDILSDRAINPILSKYIKDDIVSI